MIMLFVIGATVEALMYVPILWVFRRWLSWIAGLLLVAGLLLSFDGPIVLVVLAAVVGVFRTINLLRVIKGRSHERYLYRTARQASFFMVLAQAISVLLLARVEQAPVSLLTTHGLVAVVVLQALSGLVILRTTMRTLGRMRLSPGTTVIAEKALPTVSVLIPARNETAELERCLNSLVASTYPKLEILVLDDCSQDKTSDIIRQFAQAGVRFIHGQEPKDTWLAKNQAYDQLTDEASGDILLFLGVDTVIKPQTIRRLVEEATTRQKSMLCVMPQQASTSTANVLIQPMRYWWELAVPRRFFNRPAVLSTCWLIKKTAIKEIGGFEAVRRSIIPEAYFARHLTKNDGYGFIRSDEELGVTTQKSLTDQIERAVRVRYPEVHRRIELVLMMTLAEIVLLLAPFFLVIYGLARQRLPIFVLSGLTVACLVTAHCLILRATSRLKLLPALFNFPLIVLFELALSLQSMYKYEFSVVDWKGRNICLPVMHSTSYQTGFSKRHNRRSFKIRHKNRKR